MYRSIRSIFVVLVFTSVSLWAQMPKNCEQVGGVLMTNINAIEGQINLGPVSGDLSGSVGAMVKSVDGDGNFHIQHYWVRSTGETIKFQEAILYPVYLNQAKTQVAVPWGHYRSYILKGGTGKYTNASGYLDYFGLADFNPDKLTLVLRYEGKVCY
jgi:hypothetical protein